MDAKADFEDPRHVSCKILALIDIIQADRRFHKALYAVQKGQSKRYQSLASVESRSASIENTLAFRLKP